VKLSAAAAMDGLAPDAGGALYPDARALLHQASRLREAEPALHGVTSTVGSLQGALRRVRAEIMEPYEQARPFSRQQNRCRPRVRCIMVQLHIIGQKCRILVEASHLTIQLRHLRRLFQLPHRT
jgi:hypothetical protein